MQKNYNKCKPCVIFPQGNWWLRTNFCCELYWNSVGVRWGMFPCYIDCAINLANPLVALINGHSSTASSDHFPHATNGSERATCLAIIVAVCEWYLCMSMQLWYMWVLLCCGMKNNRKNECFVAWKCEAVQSACWCSRHLITLLMLVPYISGTWSRSSLCLQMA